MSDPKPEAAGMSVRTATNVEYAIIGTGVVALLLIFQPFSLNLFGVGCVLVVLAGLVNICCRFACRGCRRPRSSRRGSWLPGFVVVLVVALVSAYLYGELFVKAPG